MFKLSQAAQSLWAKKSSKNGSTLWLPLWAHMTDSARIAQRLWNQWLSDGIRQVIISGIQNGNEEKACKLFIFLAAIHDLGKAIPAFQSKRAFPLCRELDEHIEQQIITAGLPLRPSNEFSDASKTPHALATQVLLQDAGCPRNVAVVLGSHHGKPPGKFIDKFGVKSYAFNYHLENEGKKQWTAVQSEILNYALSLAEYNDIKEIPDIDLKSQVLFSGLLIMADWIASNESYFPYINIANISESLNYSTRIKDAWDTLELPYPWESGYDWMNGDLYNKRFGFNKPRIMQAIVEQAASEINNPGIFVIEAPMGSGKTEAALVAAEIFAYKTKRSGVFFALPTQATSDGIFPRFVSWINSLESDYSHSIELAHGKAQFNVDFQSLKYLSGSTNVSEDDESGVFIHQWFEGQKKTLLADFVVGTVDQLLLAALKQKHVMLRHLGLAGKVVIVDECHAYDAYMSQYLKRALNWLGRYGVPVIVLSATLPAQKRKMVIEAYLNRDYLSIQQTDPLGLAPPVESCPRENWPDNREYPLITYTDGEQVIQKSISNEEDKLTVEIDYISDDRLINELDYLLSDGGCAGVIVNTVKRAQELTRILTERFGEEIVYLLHSQFIAPDRADKEKRLRAELGKPGISKRPFKRIVVGTQVLEQSLDIDFDILVTDISPIDLLLQRIGRLHRHSRSRPKKLKNPICLVSGVDEDGFEKGAEVIYGKYLLMRTKAMLPKKINIPDDIAELVHNVYDDELDLDPQPLGYLQAKAEQLKLMKDKAKSATTFQIMPPWIGFEYNLGGWLDKDMTGQKGEAAVRDTDESIEVLLLYQRKNGQVHFLPWLEDENELCLDTVPNNDLAMALARQRIRLPHVLCANHIIDKTITELEQLNSQLFFVWQESVWLKGELFLLLDDNLTANLCGFHLAYDKTYGLICEKEVDSHG